MPFQWDKLDSWQKFLQNMYYLKSQLWNGNWASIRNHHISCNQSLNYQRTSQYLAFLHLCDITNNLVASFHIFFGIINFSDLIFCLKNTFNKRIQFHLCWLACNLFRVPSGRREENMVLVDMSSVPRWAIF